jgi:flagellar biosynthetic protein FliO
MKAFLRNLMLITLFLVPAFRQTTATPAQTVVDSSGSDASVAEPPVAAFPVEKEEDPGASYSMFRALGSLGLVLFLMIAGYFAARKFAPRYFAKGASDNNLKIIETLSMGDKRSISMIQVGKSRFLVGNTAHQINLLTELPESISVFSEPETLSETPKASSLKESRIPFKKLFEIEKKRPTQFATNPLPDDIRNKMRQLREALER